MQNAIRSSVLIMQRADGRVLTGLRTLAARSFPGYIAFPGGTCDDEDFEIPCLFDEDPLQRVKSKKQTTELAQERVTALREVGEETGLWRLCLLCGAPLSDDVKTDFLQRVEQEVLHELLPKLNIALDGRGLVPLGRWLTPPHRAKRFSVQQFLLLDDDAEMVTGNATDELAEIAFRDPSDVVSEWKLAERLLLPPIGHAIHHLAAVNLHEEKQKNQKVFLKHLQKLSDVPGAVDIRVRELAKGIFVQPLRSNTLPPATHTNCVLLTTTKEHKGPLVIIDPAAGDKEEEERLVHLLQHLQGEGHTLMAVVLTHHHPDHMDAAGFIAKHFSLPLWAHELTEERIDVPVDRLLHDGEMLFMGDHVEPWQVLHTPGHAPGHVCFFHEEKSVLIAGDMVAAVGSILIDPTDGDLGVYFAQLERLIAMNPRIVIPAHGQTLLDGTERLRFQLQHRKTRNEHVKSVLAKQEGPLSMDALNVAVYGDEVPSYVLPLALLSLQSIVLYLEGLGELNVDNGEISLLNEK
ncbi:MAG: MBL fold metallo-hydrolase [Deltaproteobacteria bacterium]|nr:MBL fold metallo-hydrolase [Deltaproteobacteria bacterium]